MSAPSEVPVLLPCPFCGGKVEHFYEGSSDWIFECAICKAEAHMWVRFPFNEWAERGGESGEAVRRWNRRVPADRTLDGEVEALRERMQEIEAGDGKLSDIDKQRDAALIALRKAIALAERLQAAQPKTS